MKISLIALAVSLFSLSAGAAAAQVDEARQVEALVGRAAEQVDDHRRDAGPVADPMA